MQSILQKISYRDETWAQLANYSKYYISSLGRVFSVSKKDVMIPKPDDRGYLMIDLRGDDKSVKSKRVHRLVAEAFLSDWKPEWPWTVNHINGCKSDNRICNLEMLTTQDNSKHYQTAHCFEGSRTQARKVMKDKMTAITADPDYRAKMSDRMKDVWKDPNNREMYIQCLYTRQSDGLNRKKVSDKLKEICADPEYKLRMSENQKRNWANPEYRTKVQAARQDRVWVSLENDEKLIHSSELAHWISLGYSLGRCYTGSSSTKNKVRIHLGKTSKFVDLSDLPTYLDQGWAVGRGDCRHVQCMETGQVFESAQECAIAFNTNVDLIHSRCNGTAKKFRKLAQYTFRYVD